MSAEIVIIFVGVIFLLLAISDGLLARSSSSSLVSPKLRIPLGVIGILLIIFGGFTYGTTVLFSQLEQVAVGSKKQVEYPVKKVQITSPVTGDPVECRMLTSGVYPEGHEKDIWVLLKPSDKKYYPQSDHTNTSFKRNGEWQVITRYGGDKGEVFDIIVYETDPAASQFFSTTIENWKQMESYPGLEPDQLPAGAVEVDRIEVVLSENCRGVF